MTYGQCELGQVISLCAYIHSFVKWEGPCTPYRLRRRINELMFAKSLFKLASMHKYALQLLLMVMTS